MFLGIDCGTQGTKAVIADGDGHVLGRGYAKHALIERPTGAREQEPVWWIEAAKTAILQAGATTSPQQVLSMSVSGQQHGLVVLDENKAVIRPAKLWNDTETSPQNQQLVDLFGGKRASVERFGIVPLTGYTVSKLLWLREKEPQNFTRIRHILLPHEYLNFWLTGQIFAEYGDASGTAFFDNRTRTWLTEVLDAVDGGTGLLTAALPPLLSSDQIVGTVLPAVAAELNLSPSCIVATGGGDNMMGPIGTGNVREGIVTLSLGTSSTVYSYRDAPIEDLTGNVAPFCSSSGGWLPLVCTMNATNVVTQTLQVLGKTVEDIDTAMQSTEPGAGGITFLPFLNGERTPDLPQAQGSILGIAATNYTPSNLIRSVIEGVTFGVLNGLELILRGNKVDTILVIGGGARSKEWRRMIADATGATIEVPSEEEAGCLGAIIQAIHAYGVQTGQPQTFRDLATRLVKVDADKTIKPDFHRKAAYANAWRHYNSSLSLLYPDQTASLLQPAEEFVELNS